MDRSDLKISDNEDVPETASNLRYREISHKSRGYTRNIPERKCHFQTFLIAADLVGKGCSDWRVHYICR